MEIIKGTVYNADGLPVAPSRDEIDALVKRLSEVNAIVEANKQIMAIHEGTRLFNTQSRTDYETAARNVSTFTAEATSLKAQIADAEKRYAVAIDEYRKTLAVQGQSDPTVAKILAESQSQLQLQTLASSNKKFIIIGVIIVVIIAVGGFIWYKTKKG